jgi:hypothetical protein
LADCSLRRAFATPRAFGKTRTAEFLLRITCFSLRAAAPTRSLCSSRSISLALAAQNSLRVFILDIGLSFEFFVRKILPHDWGQQADVMEALAR